MQIMQIRNLSALTYQIQQLGISCIYDLSEVCHTYSYILMHVDTYSYILIHTHTYSYILIHTSTHTYFRLSPNTAQCILQSNISRVPHHSDR